MRNQQGIYLNQKMYVIDLLKEKELLHAKAIDTPLEFGVKFQQEGIYWRMSVSIEG